ncbi:bifunctional metallophosphatase/5'-nucleotidase [Pelagibius litoralis]|uniref:Bifunctional metallophosphatase/5'-nucleotidase n=2 Tax=Pelagibius litoralis TaxID=374515 RepID=A0A967F0F1_9PROT|nr:bifunctional metallophosphatase/5'-nucleotidase [Pelagibius litoralis]
MPHFRIARFLSPVFILALLAATPAAWAESVTLTLLHINDLDRIEESKGRGGLARIMALVKQERAAADNVVFTHGGDTISPSLLSSFDKGAHMIDLYNEAELDLFVLGNHEFDFGPEVVAERIAEARFPILASNARDSDGELVDGTLATWTAQAGPYKIGFFGLVTPETPDISSPGSVTFAPLLQSARRLSDQLREEGADLIVALGHIGIEEDLLLMRADSGIDLLLSGHDHLLVTYYDGQRGFVESGSQGENLMVVDVTLDMVESRGRKSFVWSPAFRILDSRNAEPDPAMAAKVQVYLDQLSKELDIAVGKSVTPLDSRRASVRGEETAIGNLIADAMRQGVGADVALTNGGGIRGDRTYDAGIVLTRRDIQSELPFGNKTVKLSLTGEQLHQALEHGFSKVEEGAGRFPSLSGMTATWSRSAPPGQRVKAVTVGGQPLDLEATYTLATNDFIARGGDGYAVFKDTVPMIDAAAAKFMASMVMDFVAAAGEVSPKAEGRVTAVD